ncbi:nuclear transport factor 2 family protein [Aurantiacibacter sediminis]|nr:nuclear transport factor 2 family protein [Aurantiacibacter sediminis]
MAAKLEILETLARTNRAADEKNVSETAKYYTDDGFIEGDMQASAGSFESELKQIYDNEPGLKRHVGTNHIFTDNGDTVLVNSLLTVLDGEEQPSVVATADIEDELTHSDGMWKIVRHRVEMDPATKKMMAEQQG